MSRSPLKTPSTCPICNAEGSQVFSCGEYPIYECHDCRHRYTPTPDAAEAHVAATYDDDYFFGGGAGYKDYVSEQEILVARAEQYTKLMSRHCQPGTLLDVGAAVGFTMQAFSSNGWKTHGIEPNDAMATRGASDFGQQIETGTLETFTSEQQFDLITMLQVIAHFHDLQEAMTRAAQHTSSNGFWLIETWNYRSITARMFGKHWHEYSPPSVLHWFSLDSIKRLAAMHGMETIEVGRPKKWLSGEHAKSLLRYKFEALPGGGVLTKMLGVVPDRLQIPYPAEDLFWILLRKKSE